MNGRNHSWEEKGLATREQVQGGQRMQLKYCERCGALGIQPAQMDMNGGPASAGCGACRESLQWLGREVRR